MNVFVLCTGRCGSTTFIKACKHIDNYTASHESKTGVVGPERFAYPPKHIEADNRLSWFLGHLEHVYGNEAFYIHLTRDRMETAQSFLKRYHDNWGIIRAYSVDIVVANRDACPLDVCLDYVDTVNANILAFLRHKQHQMNFKLERAKEDFEVFWDRIAAEGDLSRAVAEWEIHYNSSISRENRALSRRNRFFSYIDNKLSWKSEK